MLNTSIESCHFPDKWKIARITIIFKEGDRACKENYGPISVLLVVARLFEKLIFDQLYNYRNKNNLIYWGQSAYRKLHSTATCLIKNTGKWYKGMDNGCISGTVFIDLKKAFDTVDHAMLCQKLEHYVLQLNELLWFNSYIFNRKQFCRIGGFDSDIGNIEAGVPQGSCVGPLLFLISINDLPEVVNASTVSMYADDVSQHFNLKIFLNLTKPYLMISNTLIYGCKEISYC